MSNARIPPDNELIVAAQRGDLKAFGKLVERYEGRVAATVIGMIGDCDEADDIGQETFIRCYHAMGRFRGESKLETYLTRIAINLCLNELKRRKRHKLLFVRSSSAPEADVSYQGLEHDQHEQKHIVDLALQELKPEFRSVVVLRLIDGYSTEETARILNIPMGTVLSRLARAQEKLKQHLEPWISQIL
jgi:RNA polymerase sigma-70 factor (ECF subfamily)